MTPARLLRLVFSRCGVSSSSPGWAPDNIRFTHYLAPYLLVGKLVSRATTLILLIFFTTLISLLLNVFDV